MSYSQIEKVINIMNELRVIPIEMSILNKDFYKRVVIPKKFNLTEESYKNICKIKDIKIILMDDNFNIEIEFPQNITELVFGKNFNQKVKLPKELKKLTIGDEFNQLLEFRDNLEIINFGKKFNQLIDLPKTIRSISISNNYNKPIEFIELVEEFYIYYNNQLILPILDNEIKNNLIKIDNLKKYYVSFK
jgi:hypothetical protein